MGHWCSVLSYFDSTDLSYRVISNEQVNAFFLARLLRKNYNKIFQLDIFWNLWKKNLDV